MGLVIKDEDMVRSSRENRQRKEKQAGEMEHQEIPKVKGAVEEESWLRSITVVEEYAVSVEKTCIGIRQLWPYISGQVIIPLGALVTSSSMGHY